MTKEHVTWPAPSADRHRTMIQWGLRVGGLGAVTAAIFNLVIYLQTGVWQVLVVAAGQMLALVGLLWASRLVRRDRLHAAGYWILASLALALGVAELVHSGATLFLAVGGTLLLLVVGYAVLPRQWLAWLIIGGLFLAYIALVNWWLPLPRYEIARLTGLQAFIPGIIVILILASLWRVGRALRIGTIRTRLLISFVAMALLPAIAISGSTLAVGSLAVQQQMQNHLESVAALKEAEINTWLDTLHSDLEFVLANEDTLRRIRVLLLGTPSLVYLTETRAFLQTHLQQVNERTGRFDELFLMNLDGEVVLSSDPTKEHVGSHSILEYFRQGLQGPYVTPPFYSLTLGRTAITVSRPVLDDRGQVLGVIAGHANLAVLDRIMGERAGLGFTGETYLVSNLKLSLTDNRFGVKQIYVSSLGAEQAIKNHNNGVALYDNYRGEPVVGAYHWLPRLEAVLLAEQTQAEAFQPMFISLGVIGGLTLFMLALAAGAALLITRSIAIPLADLTRTAAQIAAGDLSRTAETLRYDEIGALANSFNSMTAQLRGLIASLEQRVADRTRELARRSAYLEAAAEVGHAAASILEMDELIRQVVDRIRERFELYYVGLFLLDESGEWAVLRAGTGEAGQALLARGHRIRVGEGMIGWCVAHAEARIASQAEADAVRLAVPELSATHSEAALPLRSRGRVLGAISVQSDQPMAFDAEAITVLQTMADQVAVALDNARLFAESQAALEAVRRAYGEVSRTAWSQLLQAQPGRGYRSDDRGVIPVEPTAPPVVQPEGQHPLTLPIRVGDAVIGLVDTYKPGPAGPWTRDEIALLEALAEQLGLALESARLYQDSQRRAIREQLTGEVTRRMRETLDVDTVLRTAADAMYQALGLDEIVIRLAMPEGEGEKR